MASESASDVKLEIGHVLFIDIVGYSKLLIHEQSEQLEKLRTISRATEQFRAADAQGNLLRLPTGDGGALVFRTSPEEPVICALEISKALKNHPELRVRMGIHSGPVRNVTDLNEQANIAGAGINIAQRVMDCADEGHILLSKRVADDLEQYARWRPLLHELGTCEVKHGASLTLVNLYSDEIGNPELPKKFKGDEPGKTEASTPAVRKSIAVLPFENLSEDKANAYFADGIQEEILTRLSRIGDLKVISRTSTQRFKNSADNIVAIARQLGVANILEGSVRKAGNRVRVHVQLIDAESDAHLWAERYDRELIDIFAVESDIAAKIAEALQARLSGAGHFDATDNQHRGARTVFKRASSLAEFFRAWLRKSSRLFSTGGRTRSILRAGLRGSQSLLFIWGGQRHPAASRLATGGNCRQQSARAG